MSYKSVCCVMDKYRQAPRCDDPRVYEPTSGNPSLTVPCRAMSVREILDRYRVTGIIDGAGTPVYGVASDPKSDMIDRFKADKAEALRQAEAAENARQAALQKQSEEAKAQFEAAVAAEVEKRMKATS